MSRERQEGVQQDQPRRQASLHFTLYLYIGKMNRLQGPVQSNLNCISGIIFGKAENLISWHVLREVKLVLVIKAKCNWDKEPIIK